MDYNKEFIHIFRQQIERKFFGVNNIGGIDIGLVEDEESIYWKYKGVECQVQFYKNGNGKNNLFFNLKFQKKPGLVEKVDASVSLSKIDSSRYFGKPKREHISEGEIYSYIIRCPIKKVPKTKEHRDEMFSYAWGNLIGPMLGKAAEVI